jgi:polysaccharide export outer membrane protein
MVPILVALLAAACARQQAAYYAVDPSTGQPVPVVSQYQYGEPQYAQAGYQAGYAPPVYAQADGRGLFNAQQSYAQPYYAQAYPPPAAPPPYAAPSGRGLFNAQRGYVQQQYVQPQYVPPQYAQPPSPYQSYVLQYRPPAAAAGPYQPAPYGYAYAAPGSQESYTLDSGDKLRVVVFGQEGISGSYLVDAGGNVSLPLAGTLPARGFTTHQVAQEITDKLKHGYVREPHVTVTIDTYRPFFILGEVTTPGQYPFVPNMTVENAIAVAGGFSPRAQKRTVEITRNAGGQRFTGDVPLNYPMRPGDTIVVKERWF